MSDLINRQDAIDAIHKDILFKPLNESFYRENHEFVTVGYVERILLAVPSAEPTRCQHCKYAMAVKNQIVEEVKSAEPVIRCEEDAN